MGELLIDAAEALIADEQQSQDGFVWFRSSNDDVQRYRDGLVLDGQGVSPLVLGIAKLLPASSQDRRRPVLGRADPHRAHRDRGRLRRDHHDRAGRPRHATERRAPAAAHPPDRDQQQGIALQHMNQITERIDRESTTGAAPTFAPRFAAAAAAGRASAADLPGRVSGAGRPADPAPLRRGGDPMTVDVSPMSRRSGSTPVGGRARPRRQRPRRRRRHRPGHRRIADPGVDRRQGVTDCVGAADDRALRAGRMGRSYGSGMPGCRSGDGRPARSD